MRYTIRPSIDRGDTDLTRHLGELFRLLTRGDTAGFLAGCAPDVTLTAWGAGTGTTILQRCDLPGWLDGLQSLAGGTLASQIQLVFVYHDEHVVLLRHSFERDGVARDYETANRCAFRDGKLLAWFSYPLDARRYKLAWGTAPAHQTLPA